MFFIRQGKVPSDVDESTFIISTKIVKLLIERNADPYIKNSAGKTAVELALSYPFAKELLDIMNISMDDAQKNYPIVQAPQHKKWSTDTAVTALIEQDKKRKGIKKQEKEACKLLKKIEN
jgi:hypothetical protein